MLPEVLREGKLLPEVLGEGKLLPEVRREGKLLPEVLGEGWGHRGFGRRVAAVQGRPTLYNEKNPFAELPIETPYPSEIAPGAEYQFRPRLCFSKEMQTSDTMMHVEGCPFDDPICIDVTIQSLLEWTIPLKS